MTPFVLTLTPPAIILLLLFCFRKTVRDRLIAKKIGRIYSKIIRTIDALDTPSDEKPEIIRKLRVDLASLSGRIERLRSPNQVLAPSLETTAILLEVYRRAEKLASDQTVPEKIREHLSYYHIDIAVLYGGELPALE